MKQHTLSAQRPHITLPATSQTCSRRASTPSQGKSPSHGQARRVPLPSSSPSGVGSQPHYASQPPSAKSSPAGMAGTKFPANSATVTLLNKDRRPSNHQNPTSGRPCPLAEGETPDGRRRMPMALAHTCTAGTFLGEWPAEMSRLQWEACRAGEGMLAALSYNLA